MPRRIRKVLKPDYAKFYQKCGKWEVIFRSVNWQKKIPLANNLALSCKNEHVHILQFNNSIPKPEKFLSVAEST